MNPAADDADFWIDMDQMRLLFRSALILKIRVIRGRISSRISSQIAGLIYGLIAAT